MEAPGAPEPSKRSLSKVLRTGPPTPDLLHHQERKARRIHVSPVHILNEVEYTMELVVLGASRKYLRIQRHVFKFFDNLSHP